MSRYKYGSTSIDVDVYFADIIDEMNDDDLRKYFAERFKVVPEKVSDLMQLSADAYDALVTGDLPLARLTLEQLLFPRWKTREDCEVEYKKARANAP